MMNGLSEAIDVAAASVGNRAMSQALRGATERIREGASLTVALESTGMLEALPLEMVKVGEQTGALGDMLGAIAEFYDEELDTRMATVLSLVEPVLLVLMAIIELDGASAGLVHGLGSVLVVSRIVHPFGLRHDDMKQRLP